MVGTKIASLPSVLLPAAFIKSSSFPAITTRALTTTTERCSRMSMTNTESLYEPHRKHPALFEDTFDLRWLHSDMKELVKYSYKLSAAEDDDHGILDDGADGGGGGGGGAIKIDTDDKNTNANPFPSSLLRVEAPQVYSFRCFTETFLQMFNSEIDNFYEVSAKHNIPIKRPNSMNNYGVIVNEIGMRPLITNFQQQYLWPIAKILFPRHALPKFDDHHSFLVRYQAGEDLGLDMHTDDSDVTFNVCLGHEFTGASLTFCGMFGWKDHRKFVYNYEHEVGRAIIHLGDRRHGADDIKTGVRSNLIIWSHNWAYRESDAYKRRRFPAVYEREQEPPDVVCLSYTHDRDYSYYKELPESAKKNVNDNRRHRGWCPPPGKEYDGYPGGEW